MSSLFKTMLSMVSDWRQSITRRTQEVRLEAVHNSERSGVNEFVDQTQAIQDYLRRIQINHHSERPPTAIRENRHNVDRPSNSNFDIHSSRENHSPAPLQMRQVGQINLSNYSQRPSGQELINLVLLQRQRTNRANARNNFERPVYYDLDRRQVIDSPVPVQRQQATQANTSNDVERQSNNEFNYEIQRHGTQVNRSVAPVRGPTTNFTNRRRRGNNNGVNYTQRPQINQTNNRTAVEGPSNNNRNWRKRQASDDPVNNSCAFCFKSYEGDNSATRVTWCGHKFHLQCMNQFLPEQKRCPIAHCRRPVNWFDINNKCVVCFGSFSNEPNHTRTRIVCRHRLHKECLEQWVQTKNRCPICKRLINPKKVQENECSICLESITNNATKKQTSCRHQFHRSCLDDWLQYNNTCPLCREIVS